MDIKAEIAKLVDAAVEEERKACEAIAREYDDEEDAMQCVIAERIAARRKL